MAAKDPILYVLHIQEACERIIQYTASVPAEEPYASIVMDAVCRNLQIIGQAARRVDDAFQQAHPQVPWRDAIALRNVIVHDYDGLIPSVIREVAERDIPPLLAAVQRLLREEKP